MVNPWLQFLISAALIVYAGSTLTRNAAVIANITGIGTAWAGALMLPLATSLPELVTTLRAVSIEAPDLALGNILGSCLYNLALLAIIDYLAGKEALTALISKRHIITAYLSILTVGLAFIGMFAINLISIGWIGSNTLLIALVYIIGSRMIYKSELMNMDRAGTGNNSHDKEKEQLRNIAILKFVVAAGFIVAAGIFLTDAADQIALKTGLGHSFVGSLFLAISTSLPETVTTITAVRLAYLDMAVANVFGANFANLFIVFLADLFYFQAPLLHEVSNIQMVTAVIVMVLSAVFVFGLINRSGKTFFRTGINTAIILAGYLTAVFLIYRFGGN